MEEKEISQALCIQQTNYQNKAKHNFMISNGMNYLNKESYAETSVYYIISVFLHHTDEGVTTSENDKQ